MQIKRKLLVCVAYAAAYQTPWENGRHVNVRMSDSSLNQMSSPLEGGSSDLSSPVQRLGQRRVVITGMGLCSCLGNTLDEVSDSLYHGKSGITFNEKYAELGMKSQVCGRPKIDLNDVPCIDRKSARFMGDNAKYAFISMHDAIADAGLAPEYYENNPRAGGILGQGGTSIPDVGETLEACAERKLKRVGPYRVTRTMGSTVSAVLATAFKLRGCSYSISSACSTGAHCIGVGMEQIQLDKHDIVFCGAGELENWGSTVMFDGMGALSSKYNDEPTLASRAFDKNRDGFVIAAGGGVVVLEELEHARRRGAKIYAEITGYSATSDGYDMVAPSGEGGERCMRDALSMAEQLGGPKQVTYVNTHGTSTPVGDVKELTAIDRVFSDLGLYLTALFSNHFFNNRRVLSKHWIYKVPEWARTQRCGGTRGYLLHANDGTWFLS
mmetsp:Transcript_23398/g.30369  ORF Transcript_23398/g.30369 Transcript_23398/m.30369 type:complete len:439 (+) Transcript_23398:48-1364(+)